MEARERQRQRFKIFPPRRGATRIGMWLLHRQETLGGTGEERWDSGSGPRTHDVPLDSGPESHGRAGG